MSRLQRFLKEGPKPIWIRYLLLIAAASGMVRFALGTEWMRESAVLYVLIPYLVGLLIYVVTAPAAGVGFWARFWTHMRTALIVMMSTSLLLFEGFLCVIMFLPIYFFFAMLTIATNPRYVKAPSDSILNDQKNGGTGHHLRSSLIPAIIVILSLDGIRGTGISLGPDRATTVSRTATFDLTPAQIRANIIDHTYPASGRSALLALFPRPVSVVAQSLNVGARHTAQMEYRRWGFANVNVHRGTMVMEFVQNTPTQLRAQFIHDDSYLSHYMDFETWALDMVPLASGQTEVTITIGYNRKLAPSWYFGPLQKKAVGDGLEYALNDILRPSQ
ncbi:MAG: hypothetical protein ACSHX3_13315 [Litorimonas sp.]